MLLLLFGIYSSEPAQVEEVSSEGSFANFFSLSLLVFFFFVITVNLVLRLSTQQAILVTVHSLEACHSL